ncbi:unnamed protein product, partial [Tetraodon nigroviridis]
VCSHLLLFLWLSATSAVTTSSLLRSSRSPLL